MAPKHDVESDLSGAYDHLTRSDLEAVIQILGRSPAGLDAVAAFFVAVANRLTGCSDADRAEYTRILRGSCIFALRRWDVTGERPEVDLVIGAIDEIEGDR